MRPWNLDEVRDSVLLLVMAGLQHGKVLCGSDGVEGVVAVGEWVLWGAVDGARQHDGQMHKWLRLPMEHLHSAHLHPAQC